MKVLINDLWEEYSCEEYLTKQAAKKFFLDSQLAGDEYDEQEFQRIFSEFDTNQDGMISKDEMKRWILQESHVEPENPETDNKMTNEICEVVMEAHNELKKKDELIKQL